MPSCATSTCTSASCSTARATTRAIPSTWGERLIEHYERNRVDPRTKTLIFSDQLDFPRAIEMYTRFKDRARIAFGIGTNLTNDLGYAPIKSSSR